MITPEQLHAFLPHCDAETWAPALDAACAKYEINTHLRCAHFLAQVSEESAGLTDLVENLNYSAAALLRVWPSHFNEVEAQEYARQPERIGARAYANRLGNGDEASGEGFIFRGRGALMQTGKDNYRGLGVALGVDLIANPDLLTEPKWAALAAGNYWATHGCNALADVNDLLRITHAINGGELGLDARQAAFNAARTIWAG